MLEWLETQDSEPPNAIDASLVLPNLRLLRRLPLEEQAADVPRNI